jgi:3-dehydroquinate dehydratase-2
MSMTLRNHELLLLNGPNLNLLGTREPEIYGHDTLVSITQRCTDLAKELGFALTCRQSNHEGQLVDWLQEAASGFAGVVLNPGAYTHTSVALYDAIRAISVPVVEVHLSNLYVRAESFRQHSITAPACVGVLSGFGANSYLLGIRALAAHLSSSHPS